MATKQAPAPAPKGESEYTKAFFATGKEGQPERVGLLIDPKNPNWESGRPALFGTIEGKAVNVFVEPAGEKNGKTFGAFLTINQKGEKLEGGEYAPDTKLGKGNLVVTKDGHARLAIKLDGSDDTIWATPRKEITNELMANAGLDLEKLARVRAELAQAAANEPARTPKPKAA